MKEYKVKLYGVLVEIAGTEEITLSGEENQQIDFLLKEIGRMFPAMKLVQYRLAVNRRILESGTCSPQDELVLLPPFSGG